MVILFYLVRFFWLGLRGGFLGLTPNKSEVSAQFRLLVLSVLRLLLVLCDVFVAMQSGAAMITIYLKRSEWLEFLRYLLH